MLRPLAHGLAISALTVGLATAAAPAFAQTTTAPVAGTAACTSLVNVQSNVETARTTLQNDTNTLNTALRANPVNDATVAADRAVVAQDQANLDNVISNVTSSLCTGTAAATSNTSTTTTTTDPAPVPFVPHTRTVAAIDGEIDALSCTSSNGNLQAIDRQIAARQAQGQDVAEPVARLNDKLASLSCTGNSAVTPQAAAQTAKDCGCVNVVTPSVVAGTVTSGQFSSGAVTAKTVVPTESNGSVATTSGSEIAAANVPAGSVQTGAV